MKFRFFILFIVGTFAGIMASAQDAAVSNTAPGASQLTGYTLGPGDIVEGKVHGEMGYDFTATVDEDGMLAVPFIKKPIPAQCRTERELGGDIETEVKKYLRDPSFSFRVTEKHSRPTVSIAGESMKQLEIILTRKATLVELLNIAGGIKEEASGQIQVVRPKPPLCMAENDPDNWKSNTSDPADAPSRMYSYTNVLLGKADSNPTIYPGDRIFVKRALPIYVTGQVLGGQGVYLKENGLSLTGAIAMVGGSKPEADIKNITVYRLKPGSSPESQERDLISANLKLIRTGKQKDIMLQPYDVVIVDKAKKSVAQFLAEAALNAGRTISTALPQALPYRVLY